MNCSDIEQASFLCIEFGWNIWNLKGTFHQTININPKIAHCRLSALMAQCFRNDGVVIPHYAITGWLKYVSLRGDLFFDPLCLF